jgi:hypothetical protein
MLRPKNVTAVMVINKSVGGNGEKEKRGNDMKITTTCFLIVLSCLYSAQLCFAQEKSVTAEKLTKGDVKKALHSGEIIGNCSMRGFSGSSVASLNPDTIIIKGIYQKDGEAKIHYMGRVQKSVRADEMPVVCEADLQRLDNGEWVDRNGSILKK